MMKAAASASLAKERLCAVAVDLAVADIVTPVEVAERQHAANARRHKWFWVRYAARAEPHPEQVRGSLAG